MSSISLFRLCPVGLLFTSCSYVQTIYIQLRGMVQGAPCSPELLPPILHDASGLESHSTLTFWTIFRQETHSEELPLQGLHFLLGMLLYPEKKNSCRPTSNLVKPMPSAVGVASLSSREELDLCFLVLRYPLKNHTCSVLARVLLTASAEGTKAAGSCCGHKGSSLSCDGLGVVIA